MAGTGGDSRRIASESYLGMVFVVEVVVVTVRWV